MAELFVTYSFRLFCFSNSPQNCILSHCVFVWLLEYQPRCLCAVNKCSKRSKSSGFLRAIVASVFYFPFNISAYLVCFRRFSVGERNNNKKNCLFVNLLTLGVFPGSLVPVIHSSCRCTRTNYMLFYLVFMLTFESYEVKRQRYVFVWLLLLFRF